jgi:hypothetical protein
MALPPYRLHELLLPNRRGPVHMEFPFVAAEENDLMPCRPHDNRQREDSTAEAI